MKSASAIDNAAYSAERFSRNLTHALRGLGNYPAKVIRELKEPRSADESIEGVLGAVGEGIRTGTAGFGDKPYNPWSAVGKPAQVLGMGLRSVVEPASIPVGIVKALAKNAAVNKDVVKNNVLLAEHHIEDAEETKSKAVLKSSLHDIDESLKNIKDTLPDKATMQIHEKIAAAEQRDRTIAFQYGFVKAAEALGLDKDETVKMYDIAVKLAADDMGSPNAAIKPDKQPKQIKREKKETKPNVAGGDAQTNDDTKFTVTLPGAIKNASFAEKLKKAAAVTAADYESRKSGDVPYSGDFAKAMAAATKPAAKAPVATPPVAKPAAPTK